MEAEAANMGDRGTDSQEPESQQTPPGRLPTHSPPSATAKAAEHPSGPSAPAKAEAPALRPAKIDDCMDVPAAEKAAEADAEEFLKARQKRESTKAKEPKPKVLKRPAAISDGYVKEWRSKHHKQVIKCGRQLCQFGDLALTREQLTEIADDAIEKMRKGTLQQDACKAWCDSAVKAALKK